MYTFAYIIYIFIPKSIIIFTLYKLLLHFIGICGNMWELSIVFLLNIIVFFTTFFIHNYVHKCVHKIFKIYPHSLPLFNISKYIINLFYISRSIIIS